MTGVTLPFLPYALVGFIGKLSQSAFYRDECPVDVICIREVQLCPIVGCASSFSLCFFFNICAYVQVWERCLCRHENSSPETGRVCT
jgi:hypothetical protein